jgi:hypothetical protein
MITRPLLNALLFLPDRACPKRLVRFPGRGHNDLVGPEWAEAIADWSRSSIAP